MQVQPKNTQAESKELVVPSTSTAHTLGRSPQGLSILAVASLIRRSAAADDWHRSAPDGSTAYCPPNDRFMAREKRIRCLMSGPELAPRASKYDWALLALLALSLTFNILIAFRFTMARSNTPEVKAKRTNGAPALSVGSAMPPLTVHRLDGGSETITWGDPARPTLLYVFTPSCRWCARNAKNLKMLVFRSTPMSTP
jgi:hypothetical protein